MSSKPIFRSCEVMAVRERKVRAQSSGSGTTRPIEGTS